MGRLETDRDYPLVLAGVDCGCRLRWHLSPHVCSTRTARRPASADRFQGRADTAAAPRRRAQDASERRSGGAGVVAAGEDAETPMIMYALGAPPRDAAVQCQVRAPGRAGRRPSARACPARPGQCGAACAGETGIV
jgi:hypothetical protein